MATTAFVLLLLTTLVVLGRPPAPLTARALPRAALRGALVLSRLSDQRRARLLGGPDRATAIPAQPSRDRVPTPG